MTVGFQRSPYAGVRALVATVLIMAGACGAHVWAGGHLPTWPYLVALAGVVFAAGLLALRGTLSERVVVPLVMVAQVGLHESFGGLATNGHGGHSGHSAQVMVEAGTSPTWHMLTAHTLVTLLAAAMWRLLARAAVVVIALLGARAMYVAGSRDPRPGSRLASSLREREWLVGAPRRGPPLALSRA